MGMVCARVSSLARCMYRHVDRYVVAVSQLTRERAGELQSLFARELRRKRHLILPSHARVASLLRRLCVLPQCGTIASPRWLRAAECRWQHDLLAQDVCSMSVVMGPSRALIANPLSRSVGGCVRGAAAGAAPKALDIQAEDWHGTDSAERELPLQRDPQPGRRRSRLEIAAEIRQLLQLGRHDGGLRHVLLVHVRGPTQSAGCEQPLCVPAAGLLTPHHFPLADQSGSELRRASMLTARAAKNERVAAVFYDGLGIRPVEARYLRSRLKTQHAAAAEFSQPRQCILEAVDRAERIELVDDQPQAQILLWSVHRLEDREAHPRRYNRMQCRDLCRPIRKKQHSAALSHPMPD